VSNQVQISDTADAVVVPSHQIELIIDGVTVKLSVGQSHEAVTYVRALPEPRPTSSRRSMFTVAGGGRTGLVRTGCAAEAIRIFLAGNPDVAHAEVVHIHPCV
jgi:hypothetical protein